MSVTPKIAISDDFLLAFANLPKAQQRKTRAFLEKFRQDPRSAAIHYEPIHDMADERVRTVRIDQAYRAVAKIRFPGAHYRRDIGHKGLARIAQ